MKKNNVIQFQHVKEERFFQQKHALVNQLGDFITNQVPPSLYYRLESQFKDRTDRKLGEQQQGFFNFWLYFFHRYENGLRGIEWFLEENERRLSDDLKYMAKRWATLKPMLVQAVDQTESDVMFMDYFSKQTYSLPKSEENIPACIPWYSTFALLEPIENSYYFNGVRSFSSPKGFQQAVNTVQKLMQQTDMDRDQILIDYYPELLAALLENLDAEDDQEKEIVRYRYKFDLTDKARAENFLYNDDDFEIEQWDDTTKKLGILSNFKSYTDSEINGQVRLAEINASLEIENNTLTFTTYDLAVVNQFLRKSLRAEGAIILIDDHEERFNVPVQVEMKEMTASIDNDVPEYFILYAQQATIAELDHPIPKYNHLSLRDLVKNGKKELAEEWLKHAEYSLYKNVIQQYQDVEITPDFNTARRELGLPLSPFVTGGEKRYSKLELVNPQQKRAPAVLEADIPIYENLGFTSETINHFYTKDLIAFYKEKTNGKSEGTERKYRNSLFDIREVLEKHAKKSWEDCDLPFWESLLGQAFFELNIDISKTMVKDMITTVKALTKWLGKEKKLTIDKQITELAKNYEPRMLNAVQLLDSENPYHARAYHAEWSHLGSELKQIDKNIDDIQTGQFQIIAVNKQSVRTINVDKENELTISLDKKAVQYAEEGMILSAKIGKSKSLNVWNIIHLDRVTISGQGGRSVIPSF
ncbi:hypothetical protein JOC48_004242 [Aquibacillus albus]|uniref:Uncharacterized protein n=1 Tax=Aquibacillus albus TaxID=1168171 RepID=A0ABS2N6D7_9BACI|nr:hypothetical protein [Aquibacillus albus]